MKLDGSWRITLFQILLGVALVIALVVVRGTNAGNQPIHLTTDWSHRHLVFSTQQSLIEQIRLSSNPRYVQQWIRRNAEKQGDGSAWRWGRASGNPNRLQGDWSIDIGAGAKVSAGMYPAKYSFDATTATCAELGGNPVPSPDFVVYTTGLAGSATQATILAFTNLYVGTCSTVHIDTPNSYWAYNTGTTGAILTSPVLSADGSQVAFIQNTATAATLVVLRWAQYDGFPSGPATPTAEAAGSYNGCTAPCMTTLAFSTATGGPTVLDTTSSPFYDYRNDVLYVGDDGGYLHKFTGVFRGTPTEVISTTGADIWPADVSYKLRSPVFDESVNEVFVCDNTGVVYRVDATIGSGSGGINHTVKLGDSAFDDAPLVDATTGNLYVFARGDEEGGPTFPNPSQRAGVFQMAVNFPNNANLTNGVTEVAVSSDNTLPVSAFYVGDFDNAYYTSMGGTGNLYVCSTNGNAAALWRIPITTGVLGTTVLGPTLTTANAACSPVTEFASGSTDRIFLSVEASSVTASPISCPGPSGGCIMSFDVTTTAGWGSGKTTSATAAETGGTSGIVIDNSSSTTGASQIYFTPLADQLCTSTLTTGGCAIQASQSALD